MANSTTSLEAYQKTDELMDVFRLAVKEAQIESHHRGVPNVYYFDGNRYFELPSGKITQKPPVYLQGNGAEQSDELDRELPR